jgi:hypothetical protein
MTRTLKDYRDDTGKLESYAWPGGYPLFYLADDGSVFCPSCANQGDAEPEITGADVNWEDASLFCDGCGNQILSAYGEDEER